MCSYDACVPLPPITPRYAPAGSAEGKDEATQMEDASRNSFAVSIVSDVRKSPERDLSRAMPRSRSSSSSSTSSRPGSRAKSRPVSRKSSKLKVQSSSADSGLV
jgi:hypothetical protein